MNPADNTPPPQTQTLVVEVELRHPPAKVWRALTEPALLAQWLLPATGFAPTPGTDFTLRAPRFSDRDGTIYCRILALEEYKVLREAGAVPEMALETVVTFTLTPTDLGTQPVIEQSRFNPNQKQNFGGARYGWKRMAGALLHPLERIS